MENQHRKIKGYRELNQNEIDQMNTIKEKGVKLQKLIDDLFAANTIRYNENDPYKNADMPDEDVETLMEACRWLTQGQMHLQQGLMCLTRAVAKPDFF